MHHAKHFTIISSFDPHNHLWTRCSYYHHFTDEETEVKCFAQGHTASKSLHPDLLDINDSSSSMPPSLFFNAKHKMKIKMNYLFPSRNFQSTRKNDKYKQVCTKKYMQNKCKVIWSKVGSNDWWYQKRPHERGDPWHESDRKPELSRVQGEGKSIPGLGAACAKVRWRMSLTFAVSSSGHCNILICIPCVLAM